MPPFTRPSGQRAAASLQAAAMLFATLAAMLFTTAAAQAAGITVAPDGNDPGIEVDAAGTGHVAFKSAVKVGSATNYDYSYCRLPRGATECAPRIRLATPGNLSPFGRARVLVDATRVIVVGNTCCGGGSGVYAWTSTNSGQSFGPPKQVSTEMWVREAILGPGENSVSVIDYVSSGGLQWVTGSLAPASPPAAPWDMGPGSTTGASSTPTATLPS